jgi:RNA polymerase sigma-70 factor (ECF subfamily)
VSAPAKVSETVAAPDQNPADWFADQVHVHDAQLKSYLRGSFPSVRDVEDVVQESYLRVWRVRATQPILSAKAFLFTVARNVALKVLRKNSNAPFASLGDSAASRVIDHRPGAPEALCVQEKVDLLADAVMTLPARCREIIILHKLQGLPQKEVAAKLGLSERTVECQVRIGVKRCLVFFQERGVKNFHGDET